MLKALYKKNLCVFCNNVFNVQVWPNSLKYTPKIRMQKKLLG